LLDNSGKYVDILPSRDMRKTEGIIRFVSNQDVFTQSNVSVVVEDEMYPQYLEVEAWLRQTLGRLIAPFMGKQGRSFIYDSHSRFACGPPRVAITWIRDDGTKSVTRYRLPHTEHVYYRYGTLMSEDGEFLYIYYHNSGAVIRLNDLR